MGVVRARHAGRTRTAEVLAGATLREGIEETGLRVRTACKGNGSCGLCQVRIVAGEVSAPTVEERLQLDAAQLDAGLRLACQARLEGDVELELVHRAADSVWRSIAPAALTSPVRPTGPSAGPSGSIAAYAALDVGTTNLCLALWSDDVAHRLATRRGPNPQARFGADVVSRLEAARDRAAAAALALAVEQGVADALDDIALRDAVRLARVSSLVAVGNAAMLSLLQASDGGLLDPARWAGGVPSSAPPLLHWTLADGREATVHIVPPLGGFVGSDLLAAVLAAELVDRECPALLLDFGTNTEIALWDGRALWVTSAAGGPAFESSGMSCAVPAEPGAVDRVWLAGGELRFEVIAGADPTGVCGSGLVDWLACLVRLNALSSRGRLAQGSAASAPALMAGGRAIPLTVSDVDVFQRAKAAIGAGVRLLARRAEVPCAELRRVVSTGLFGRALDIANAQAVGLLPIAPAARFEAYDNLALSGCELLLGAGEGARALEQLRPHARLVNLAQCVEFEDLFVEELFLRPMGGLP